MKKFLTFVLVCCLVFSSSSTVFANATQWDTSDQANLRYIANSVNSSGSLYNLVNNIYSKLSTISNTLTDIKGYLFDSNHSITYWVHAITTWMQPLYTAVSSIPTNHEEIKRLLGYVSSQDGVEVIDPYLAYQSKGVAQWVSELSVDFDDLAKALTNYYKDSSLVAVINSHSQFIGSSGVYGLSSINGAGTKVINYRNWKNGSPLGNIALIAGSINENIANGYSYTYQTALTDFNSVQTATDWLSLENKTFTPTSATNGIYQWLSNIQAPVARLSYVLASDERIEAQEKAAANEEAVVNNFIDSSGSGAASTSDIGSVSDLSSGFKNNISTDASVSGIWNIFNSDNFGWFSQETANQLDTSGSGTRTLRSSRSYPTPLLDKQTEDILKYIGGDNND